MNKFYLINNIMRVEQLLNIMEAFLDALKYEQMCEAFGWEDPIDFMCDDSDDWEGTEEEREEVTENVKDNSPRTLKEEKEHLSNLLDSLCELFWVKRINDNGVETVVYDPKIIEEVHKAMKKRYK